MSSGGTGLGTGLQTAGDAESLLGLPAGTGGSAASASDWDKISKALGGVGKSVGGSSDSQANYLRIRAGDAPVEPGSASAANLLLTLIQMHRNAMASSSQQQPRTSLLG